jgi:hypothetical protein
MADRVWKLREARDSRKVTSAWWWSDGRGRQDDRMKREKVGREAVVGGHPVDPVHPVRGAENPHRAFTSASGGGHSAEPSGKPTFRGHSNQQRTYSNPWAIDHRRTTRRNPRRRVPQPPPLPRRRVRPSLTRRRPPARRSNRPSTPAIPRSCRDAGFPFRAQAHLGVLDLMPSHRGTLR